MYKLGGDGAASGERAVRPIRLDVAVSKYSICRLRKLCFTEHWHNFIWYRVYSYRAQLVPYYYYYCCYCTVVVVVVVCVELFQLVQT